MFRTILINVAGTDGQLPKTTPVAGTFNSDAIAAERPLHAFDMPDDGRLRIIADGPDPNNANGVNLWLVARGYQDWRGRGVIRGNEFLLEAANSDPLTADGLGIQLTPGDNSFRKTSQVKFSRDQICGVDFNFNGQRITTNQFGGNRYWFEPVYQCLTSAQDRRDVVNQKLARSDHHLILEFFTHEESVYNSGWTTSARTRSMERDPAYFRELVQEAHDAGLVPIVVPDGDDGQSGHYNAMRQLPMMIQALDGLNEQVLYARLWDGVFYGSTPEQIQEFGRAFRRYNPRGHLALEHQPGRPPVGNGRADYAPGGMMSDYDTILHEFNWPIAPNLSKDRTIYDPEHNIYTSPFEEAMGNIWQIGGRMLGPRYRRPADQPADNDPGSGNKWYLAGGNPRGEYFPVAFETWRLYNGVHGQEDYSAADVDRKMFREMGWQHAC